MFRTTTPLQRLRESYAMASLPDTIRTGELGEFGEPIGKPLSIATVDDISFALLRINEEIDAHLSRANALQHLHDRARRAGATGAENAVEAALRFEERRK